MTKQFITVICLLVLMPGLTACDKDYLQAGDVDISFQQDYVLISDITEYMLSLEETPVYIECEKIELRGRFGEPMDFQSPEIERLVEALAEKGYLQIQKMDSIVVFDIWRKRFNEEFESGFVYSTYGTGDLSAIPFLVYQRPLSKENWYYYESDYNEWRSAGNEGQ
jgi:hypothetical protein